MKVRKRTESKRVIEREEEGKKRARFLVSGYFIENNPISANGADTFTNLAACVPLTGLSSASVF